MQRAWALAIVSMMGCGTSAGDSRSVATDSAHVADAAPTQVASSSAYCAPNDSVAPVEPDLSALPPRLSASSSEPTVPVLATPPWPPGTNKLQINWVLHDAGELGRGGLYGRHIDLSVRVGAVTRNLGIDARISITFAMQMQPACDKNFPREGKVVAELYMNGGGNLWYTVEPREDGALQVFENSSTDGLCTDAHDKAIACPVDRALIGVIEAPKGALLTERFLEVERVEPLGNSPARIHETPLDCGF